MLTYQAWDPQWDEAHKAAEAQGLLSRYRQLELVGRAPRAAGQPKERGKVGGKQAQAI